MMSALRARILRKLREGRNSLAIDANRDAGAALVAGRPIGDRLAAPEAAMGEQVVEVAGLVADQMGEHLALVPARQIGAGRGRGQVELRGITRMLGHGMSSGLRSEQAGSIAPRRPTVNRFGQTAVARTSGQKFAPAAPPGTHRTVDNHGSQDDVVQQAAAAVEQPDQQDRAASGTTPKPRTPPHAWRRARNSRARRTRCASPDPSSACPTVAECGPPSEAP